MHKPSDAAISVEAVKVAMSQTKDGVKITLVLHPSDDINDLFVHPVGSRYQVAMVLLDDENNPVMPKHKADTEKAVTAAAMMCREEAFQKWLVDQGYVLDQSEAAAIKGVHLLCGINSRAELRVNPEARQKFNDLRLKFSKTRMGL